VASPPKLTLLSNLNLRQRAHPNCVVCGSSNEFGLQVEFETLEDGSVQATFGCDEKYEGYGGVLHGGVISSLLDAFADTPVLDLKN
jgi:acyl-coenzyme A thioesterase PaaI-like protein